MQNSVQSPVSLRLVQLAALLIAVVALTYSSSQAPANAQAPTRTRRQYVSPDGLFGLTIPPTYILRTGRDKKSRAYIPVCHDESVVCVEVPETLYQGTNFGDASIEVTLISAKTRVACETPGRVPESSASDARTFPEFKVDPKHPTRLIDRTSFVRASPVGGAAAGHEEEIYRYRGFKNDLCYDLTMRVTYTAFGNFEPGTIREFTGRDKSAVMAELTRILESFKTLH